MRREASIFACLTDAVVAPAGPLPSVRETDAVAAFGRYLERSPAINRVGLRAMLFALELGPLAFGYRRRMRALSPGTREAYLTRLDSSALSFALVVLRSLPTSPITATRASCGCSATMRRRTWPGAAP